MKKLLYMLLALLGISATGCDFMRVEYGTPHVHFNLKARVVDEAGKPIEVPKNYYPDNDDSKAPVVRWRSHANLLFSNWLNYFVYQTTPYDIDSIGK